MKSSYNLEVVARDDGQQITAPVTVHITKDAQDDASIEQFTDKLNDLPETLEYSVLENVEGKSRYISISDLLSPNYPSLQAVIAFSQAKLNRASKKEKLQLTARVDTAVKNNDQSEVCHKIIN